MVRKAVDLQEATADQDACAPLTRGNNCPPVENLNQTGGDLPEIKSMNDKELHECLHSMGRKECRELPARLRLVKPKRKKVYKENISDQQRLQLEYELQSRGFDGSEYEVNLLVRGGSLPSGSRLRIFYQNGRLREDTSGGSITDQPKNFLFLTHIRAFLLKVKKAFYIYKLVPCCIYIQCVYTQLCCVSGRNRRENAELSFGVIET